MKTIDFLKKQHYDMFKEKRELHKKLVAADRYFLL